MAIPASVGAPGRAGAHRTVTRVTGILEAVVAAEPGGLRLGELAGAVGAPKSSIHGLAKGLVVTGYLNERSGRYYKGSAVTNLLGGSTAPSSAFRHALEDLSTRLNETAVLGSLVGFSVVHLDSVESAQMIRASPTLHQRRGLWPLSHGKCFLAAMPATQVDAYLAEFFDGEEARDGARRELSEVRKMGFAINTGAGDEYGVSSPIVRAGHVVLTIGVAGPTSRMVGRLGEITAAVQDAAASLSG